MGVHTTKRQWLIRERQLVRRFGARFGGSGHKHLAAVPVSSRVDPTVRFVGSTISVLKPRLDGDLAPVCLAQPAIRTQNLQKLLDPSAEIEWSTLFMALGTLASYAGTRRTAELARDFLLHDAEIEAGRLIARCSSRDPDLVAIAEKIFGAVEIDGSMMAVYRHHYGEKHLSGRNFNLAILTGGHASGDVANVIVVERNGTPVGVEFACGVSTTFARRDGLAHPLQGSPIADLLPTETQPQLKLADAVAATAHLLAEGLRPVSRGRQGILRRYIQAIPPLLGPAGVSAVEACAAASEISGERCGRVLSAQLAP